VAWALAIVAAVFAVGDWVAVGRGSKRLEYMCKPAALVALIAIAASLDAERSGMRAWFLGALVLCLAGDVFLMLPSRPRRDTGARGTPMSRRERDFFVPGLAAFLLGHLAYIGGLGLHADAVAVGAVLVVGVLLGGRSLRAVRQSHGDLTVPVAAYMMVISVMVVCALSSGYRMAAVAACVFYASDALIAWNRFVHPLPWAPVAIMVTYHVAQAGFVASLVRG
jgi:uncharacterized membrane protein YhhN